MLFKTIVRFVMLVIFAIAIIMASALGQEQEKAEVITQQEYFKSFIPVTQVPTTFYFAAESPLLRGLGFHFQVTIKELLEDGSIKLMRSQTVDDNLQQVARSSSDFNDVVTSELGNETHIFKFKYEWHLIQIGDPAEKEQEENRLCDTIALYLRDKFVSPASLNQLGDDLRDKVISRFNKRLKVENQLPKP